MCFCNVVVLYTSELLLSEHSLNHCGRSSIPPPLGPLHTRRSIESSPPEMFPIGVSFAEVVVSELFSVVDAVAAVIAATNAARSWPSGAAVVACV